MTTTGDDLLGVLRPDGDRVAVRFERTYRTSAQDLWSALTEPERVGRWLAALSGDLRVGGAYRLDYGDDETTGTVTACEPPRRLEVTWDFPGEPPSRLLLAVTERDDAAHLLLDHERLPPDQGSGYGAGWHAHLAGLGAVLNGEPRPDWDARFAAELPRYRALAAGQRTR